MTATDVRQAATVRRPGSAEVEPGLAEVRPGSAEVRPGFSEVGSSLTEVRSGFPEVCSGSVEVGPGPVEVGLGCVEVRPGLADLCPGPVEVGPDLADLRSGPVEVGPDLAEVRSGLVEVGSGRVEVCPGLADLCPGPVEVGPDLADLRSGPVEVRPDLADLRSGPVEVGPGFAEVRSGLVEVGSGRVEVCPGLADLCPGPVEVGPGLVDLCPGPVAVRSDLADLCPGPVEVGPGLVDLCPGPVAVRSDLADLCPGPVAVRPDRADPRPAPVEVRAGLADPRPHLADPRPSPADLRAAAERIAPYVLHTPLLPGPPTALDGPRLLLKAEHLQPAGSFKVRGAANAVLALGADRVVTGSSGNHGIALARLARTLGSRLTVVLAAGAAPAKAAAIRALGAQTVRVGGGVAEREERARALASEQDAVLIPSSDHPLVVAGQGTVGAEVLADAPDAQTVYVPTGGGGLLAGVCLAADGHPVRVVGVEPAATPRYARSLAAGHPVQLPPSTTVADGLRGQRPGSVPYPIIRDRVDDLIAVGDAEILAAAALLRRYGIDAEPSGAVALAGALRAGRRERAVAVVSGGNTPARLHDLHLTHPHSKEHTS